MGKQMKWKFSRYLPDLKDATICHRTLAAFLDLEYKSPLNLNDGERNVHNFVAGFNRGTSWGIYKTKRKLIKAIEEYLAGDEKEKLELVKLMEKAVNEEGNI